MANILIYSRLSENPHEWHSKGQEFDSLFVSAYHGFVTLGVEHIPTPQRFVKFPPFAVKMENAVRVNESLVISTVVTMAEG